MLTDLAAGFDQLLKSPNAALEGGFWKTAVWLKLAKRRIEDKEDLFFDMLAGKCLLGAPLFNIPNCLSMSRFFVFMPLFLLAVAFGNSPYYSAQWDLVAVGLTDWLDGVLARYAKKKKLAETGIVDTNRTGGLIDACADKGFMIPAFIAMKKLMDAAVFWALLGVEMQLLLIAVFAGWQMHMGRISAKTNTDSVSLGKIKFAIECAGILALLNGAASFGNKLLWASFILAIGSILGKGGQILATKNRI